MSSASFAMRLCRRRVRLASGSTLLAAPIGVRPGGRPQHCSLRLATQRCEIHVNAPQFMAIIQFSRFHTSAIQHHTNCNNVTQIQAGQPPIQTDPVVEVPRKGPQPARQSTRSTSQTLLLKFRERVPSQPINQPTSQILVLKFEERVLGWSRWV